MVLAIGSAVAAYGVGVLSRAEDEAAGATVRLGQRLLARILHRASDPASVQAAVTDLAAGPETELRNLLFCSALISIVAAV